MTRIPKPWAGRIVPITALLLALLQLALSHSTSLSASGGPGFAVFSSADVTVRRALIASWSGPNGLLAKHRVVATSSQPYRTLAPTLAWPTEGRLTRLAQRLEGRPEGATFVTLAVRRLEVSPDGRSIGWRAVAPPQRVRLP